MYRNKLKSLLFKAEKDYYCCKFKSFQGNLRKTWQLLREVMHNSRNINVVNNFIADDGSIITNPQEVVDNFNDYFVNIGDFQAASILPPSNYQLYQSDKTFVNSFIFHPTDAYEIVQIVNTLQDKSSFGIDCIPTTIMKHSILHISQVVSSFINCSFRTGTVPNQLKVAKVCPIYKGGANNCFSNYRPISVLPCFSKIFEKAAYNRILSYVNVNNIIINNQYGFRRDHSAYMAILDMCNYITESIDEHNFSAGVFIDLSKAFDTLNQDLLLHKLEGYGIRGIALHWFKDYLYNRKQYVVFNNYSSSFKDITCGVPQGSILGPLLFILYINDIVLCSKLLKFILFADDTNLFFSSKSIKDLQNIINTELDKLSNWFRIIKLSINVSKTKFILFGRRSKFCCNPNFCLKIDSKIIEQVKSTKFLGIFIDVDLS